MTEFFQQRQVFLLKNLFYLNLFVLYCYYHMG